MGGTKITATPLGSHLSLSLSKTETSYSLGKRISIRAKRSTPLIFVREVKELFHGHPMSLHILSRPSPETGCPSVPWLWISNSLQRCICLRLLREVTDSSAGDDKIQFAQVEEILEKKNEAFSIFAFGRHGSFTNDF